MKHITCEELKNKLDRKDRFKLVMVLNEWAFQAKHIPGSINIHSEEEGRKQLHPDDEIVVYCSNEACIASVAAYNILDRNGFQKVQRFAGGLDEWEKAGYTLVGEMVK